MHLSFSLFLHAEDNYGDKRDNLIYKHFINKQILKMTAKQKEEKLGLEVKEKFWEKE